MQANCWYPLENIRHPTHNSHIDLSIFRGLPWGCLLDACSSSFKFLFTFLLFSQTVINIGETRKITLSDYGRCGAILTLLIRSQCLVCFWLICEGMTLLKKTQQNTKEVGSNDPYIYRHISLLRYFMCTGMYIQTQLKRWIFSTVACLLQNICSKITFTT